MMASHRHQVILLNCPHQQHLVELERQRILELLSAQVNFQSVCRSYETLDLIHQQTSSSFDRVRRAILHPGEKPFLFLCNKN